MGFDTSTFAQSGRFTQITPIGQGAAGKVYSAFDTKINRWIAVKEALPQFEQRFIDSRARFEKEVQIQAQVHHQNIVTVFDLQEDPNTGEIYLFTEYANGGSLANYLEKHGKVGESLACKITLDICSALEKTRLQKIIHRDIKPSNILLFTDDQGTIQTAKLADFGVAQDHKSRRTTAGPNSAHPGTPLYSAPEQSSALNILDSRSDLYALGITLWEMLTNEDYKPLVAQNAQVKLQDYNPVASKSIEAIIQKAIQTEPNLRYQTPEDMANDLRTLQTGGKPTIAYAYSNEPKIKKATPPERVPSRARYIIPILLLLLLGLGGAGYATNWFGLGGSVPPTSVANVPSATDVAGGVPLASEATATNVPTLIPATATIEPTTTATAEPTETPKPTQTPKPTATPTPEPTATPEPDPRNLYDNFDQGISDKWTIVQPGLVTSNGRLEGSGKISFDPQSANYVIRMTIKGYGYAINFRVSDFDKKTGNPTNGYIFRRFGRYDTDQGSWGIYKDASVQSGTNIKFNDKIFDTNEHMMEIRVEGRTIKVYVDDGKEAFSTFTDETFSTGKIAIEQNGASSIDNFSLEVLP
ncbi:MAG: serine/threonine protein kinase [Herpetosiphon sp.]|nr:serine/threonine protein kinase [Herpetosiphon sp.]